MSQDPNDALRQILRRLESLDEKLASLEERIGAMETPRPEVETQVDEPINKPSSIPAVPARLSETAYTENFPYDSMSKKAQEFPPPLPAEPALSPVLNSPAVSKEFHPDNLFQQAIADFRPQNLPRKKPQESWEVRIATYWLPRVGLLFLALVCILFAKEYSKGPLGKVLVAYGVAIGLIIAGVWKEKKYPAWSRPVLAGGLAFTYFASYSMGFVEPMRLIDNLAIKLIILAANLVLIFGVSHWKKSEAIGGTALVLGYLTTGVVGSEQAAFCSSLALSLAAVLFLWLNQWFVSTAVSCAATYVAHFYVWKAVPEGDTRSAFENYWFHFTFLSLYFLVFTAATFTGKKAALENRATRPDMAHNTTFVVPTPLNLLTILTQTNVAAYIAGMITVLKLTQVYWDHAWMFFFPMAALLAFLGLVFAGLARIQIVYLVAGALCLSFGIISLASPFWLPIFLALQATAMVWGSKGRYTIWRPMAFLILCYAAGYVLSDGTADLLGLSSAKVVNFPWWTHTAVAAIAVAFGLRWEKTSSDTESDILHSIPYAVSALAAAVWWSSARKLPSGEGLVICAAAVPLAGLVAVFGKCKSTVLFVCLMAIICLLNIRGLIGVGTNFNWHSQTLLELAVLGFAVGLLAEKYMPSKFRGSRVLWRVIYVWSAIMLATASMGVLRSPEQYLVMTCFYILSIAAAWSFHSAALGKTAYIFVPFVLLIILTPLSHMPLGLVCAGLLAAGAYPLALPRWRFRTCDTAPLVNQLGQAAVMIAAGILFYWVCSIVKGWNPVLVLSIWGVFCALFSICGRFAGMVPLVVIFGAVAVARLWYNLWFSTMKYNQAGDVTEATTVGLGLLGIMLFVASERIVRKGSRMALPGANPVSHWLTASTHRRFTAAMAVGTLMMALVALRTLPDLKLFYFTGAIVAAAFVWIVFGFFFNEPVYRKSGFILLCFGIIKGLVWDVLSLKETFYRIVSWSILGLLALAASYLYTRFRGRVSNSEEEV